MVDKENIRAPVPDRNFLIEKFRVSNARYIADEVARWKEILKSQLWATSPNIDTDEFVHYLDETHKLSYTDSDVDAIMAQLITDVAIEPIVVE